MIRIALPVAMLLSGCGNAPPPADTPPSSADAPENEIVVPADRLPVLEELWITEGFSTPESALLSEDDAFYYISDVNQGADGFNDTGFIARLGLDGEIADLDWVTGLDAPKGMALHGGYLYVSDITALIEIDAERGVVNDTIAVPGARQLNDVTYMPGLGILISDPAQDAIYLHDFSGPPELWLQDERLDTVNGILADGERLLAVTMATGELLEIDPQTKEIQTLGDGMVQADMMAVLGNGSYIVSSWPGTLYHVSTDGETSVLQDTTAEEIYVNDITLNGDMLIAPNWNPGTVTAYRVILP